MMMMAKTFFSVSTENDEWAISEFLDAKPFF